MNSQLQTLEIKDIGELKTILQEISEENATNLNQYLQGYLKHENDLIKKLSQECIEQISRKQCYLQNLVQFSLHLLEEIQRKEQALTVSYQRVTFLEKDLQKVNEYNMDLLRRLEEMEEENTQYIKRQQETNEVINKLEQSRCYLQELSHRECQSNTFDDLYQLQGVQTLQLNKIHSSKSNNNSPLHNQYHQAFTQRTPAMNTQVITIQEHQQKLSMYKSSIDTKSLHINQLQHQIHHLHSKISSLNNQLEMKQSQLELSQIYYKEKLQLVKSHHQSMVQQCGNQELNQNDVKSVFKRQLARVESVESIQSYNKTEENYDPFNNVADLINEQCAQSHYQRNPHIRRSLMQQFVTDFMFEAQQQDPVYSSQIIHSDSFSQIQDSGRQRKKTISVSTTDFKNMLSRGVQTVNNQNKVIVRKTQGNRYVKKDTLDDSFLGSVASMFTKKVQPNQKYPQNKLLKQESKDNKQVSFFDSPIGNMFKGIYDYATKKIVTQRIQKKKSHHNASLNHSFLDELKPMKKSGYHKGMRQYYPQK